MSDNCPKCGGNKPSLMACLDCGYSYLKSKSEQVKASTQICPRCGLNSTKEHIKKQSCKDIHYVPNAKSTEKLLPDLESE